MKKIYLTIVLALLAIVSSKADGNTVKVDDTRIFVGKQTLEIPLYVTNQKPLMGFEFSVSITSFDNSALLLPSGLITFEKVVLADRTKGKSATGEEVNLVESYFNGQCGSTYDMRCAAIPLTETPINGKEGQMLTIVVNVSDAFPVGEYAINVFGALMEEEGGEINVSSVGEFVVDYYEKDGLFFNLLTSTGNRLEVMDNKKGSYTGKVVIPEKVTFKEKEYSVVGIGAEAFKDCADLTSVAIPTSVSYIGASAFEGCSSLKEITIPGSVESIGARAFYGLNLTSLTLQEGIGEIGEQAFYNCGSLTEITIPGSVNKIGDSAFSNCKGLTSVNMCNGVKEIGTSAFQGCSNLTEITIPGSVGIIGESAFYNLKLTSVTLQDGIGEIGTGAFYNCGSLTEITIPGSVNKIGDRAFRDCKVLTSVNLRNGLQEIGASAFSGSNSITTLTIPASVTTIGGSPFSSTITTLIVLPINPPKTKSPLYITSAKYKKVTLYVPTESFEIYSNTDPWSKFIIEGGAENMDTGIKNTSYRKQKNSGMMHTLDGRAVNSPVTNGVYIKEGKKIAK